MPYVCHGTAKPARKNESGERSRHPFTLLGSGAGADRDQGVRLSVGKGVQNKREGGQHVEREKNEMIYYRGGKAI